MQPLAFSKELLPVGTRIEGERERPMAVSEYLMERMILAGCTRICFVISPGKSDIMEYYGGRVYSADVCYTLQPEASGLCDAIFRAAPFIATGEPVAVGLPDTVWFPENGLTFLPDDVLSFLVFPVERPDLFDAVRSDEHGRVLEIQVKHAAPSSKWVWGAFKMPGRTFLELRDLWLEREKRDEYFGTLVNEWLARGGRALAVFAGETYVDVGTIHGYREALKSLGVYA